MDSRIAKIVAAVVVVAVGVFVFRTVTGGDDSDGSSPGAPVQVTVDAEGRTVVTNVEGDGFEVRFVIPQNCAELRSVLETLISEVVDFSPNEEQTRLLPIYQSLAEDVCNVRQFRALLTDVLNPFYGSINATGPEESPLTPDVDGLTVPTLDSTADDGGSVTEPAVDDDGSGDGSQEAGPVTDGS